MHHLFSLSIQRQKSACSAAVVPKLGANYLPGKYAILVGLHRTKPHCCSVLWAITAKEILTWNAKNFYWWVIRHNCFLDLGNGSNKFGNNCSTVFYIIVCIWKNNIRESAGLSDKWNKSFVQFETSSYNLRMWVSLFYQRLIDFHAYDEFRNVRNGFFESLVCILFSNAADVRKCK